MSQEPLLTPREIELIKRTAARTARSWRLVERDDLEQELYLWALTHPAQIERFRGYGEGSLVLTLKRLALDLAKKETRHKIGQDLEATD